MKQFKRLTRKNKEYLSKADKRVRVENWMLYSELRDSIIVINKLTGRKRVIDKV